MNSSSIVSFRDLDAWNVAVDLSVIAYKVVRLLPSTERFELGTAPERRMRALRRRSSEDGDIERDRTVGRRVRL